MKKISIDQVVFVIVLVLFICLISFKGSSEITDNFFPTSNTKLNDGQIEPSVKSNRNIVWYETELKVFLKTAPLMFLK